MALPFNAANKAANPEWLRDVLGPRIRIEYDRRLGSWLVARIHADRALDAMVDRFGDGRTTVVTDAAQQRKCGRLCQQGKPENALACECQCGGENHGGVSGNWILRDSFAVETQHLRRVFTV